MTLKTALRSDADRNRLQPVFARLSDILKSCAFGHGRRIQPPVAPMLSFGWVFIWVSLAVCPPVLCRCHQCHPPLRWSNTTSGTRIGELSAPPAEGHARQVQFEEPASFIPVPSSG